MHVTPGEVIDGVTIALCIISFLTFIRLYKIFTSKMNKIRSLLNSIDDIIINKGKYNSKIFLKKLMFDNKK
ncbi:MAG: hypothetical protein QW776_01175 [Candidatus Nitrosocaldus sp.]